MVDASFLNSNYLNNKQLLLGLFEQFFMFLIIILPSDSFDLLRFSPSTADTDWLLGSLFFLEGEMISWLNRFRLTLVTSVDNRTQLIFMLNNTILQVVYFN